MAKFAVTYSPEVGGSSVVSLKEAFKNTGVDVVDADYRELMRDIPEKKFNELYHTQEGRVKLFAHAKIMAENFLRDKDGLALSGNSAMIDPELFNQQRDEDQKYDLSRTIAELALVHVASQKGMPILGICGGHQVVAVYEGGTIVNLNADQLEQQRFMNYDNIKVNKQTMLGQIIGNDTNGYQPFGFGAHIQRVDKVGKGYVVSGHDSTDETIEGLESEHGVPIITTQFHPEVGAKGLPSVEHIYRKPTIECREQSMKLFDFFNKAGDAYAAKRNMNQTIKTIRQQSRDMHDVSRTEEFEIIAPTRPSVSKQPFEKNKAQSTNSNISSDSPTTPPKAKSIFTFAVAAISTLFSVIFANVHSLVKGLINILAKVSPTIATGVRNKVSTKLTNKKVKALRKKEVVLPDGDVPLPSTAMMERMMPPNVCVDSPKQILTETRAELYKVEVEDKNRSSFSRVTTPHC